MYQVLHNQQVFMTVYAVRKHLFSSSSRYCVCVPRHGRGSKGKERLNEIWLFKKVPQWDGPAGDQFHELCSRMRLEAARY